MLLSKIDANTAAQTKKAELIQIDVDTCSNKIQDAINAGKFKVFLDVLLFLEVVDILKEKGYEVESSNLNTDKTKGQMLISWE